MWMAGRLINVQVQGATLGHVTANGKIIKQGRIEGNWYSSIGTGGTFWAEQNNYSTEIKDSSQSEPMEELTFIMMSISSSDASLEDSLRAIKRASFTHGIGALRVDE